MERLAIAVTRRVPPSFLEELSARYEVRLHDALEPLGDGLPAFLRGVAGAILAPYDRIDAALLDTCPGLRIAANASAGHDNLDLVACAERRVLCSNAPDGATQSTADFAMGLLVAAARRVIDGDRLIRQGGWNASTYESFMTPPIAGSTLGIVGMGRIGQAIARRASLGFRMRVLYASRSRLPVDVEDFFQCRRVDQDQLLAQADHVMVALPLSNETRNAIGAPEFALMRPQATFVNVGRGGVVDEVALAAALREGRLGAAALDVFEGEPCVRDELLETPRLLMTPHIASATLAARLSTLRQAASNVHAGLEGRVPPNALNAQAIRQPSAP